MTRPLAAAILALALPLAGGAALAQDAADTVVRLNRVEGQMRQLSGQLEQLQFENRQLRDQLRKFQEDTEFRLNERAGGRPAAAPPAAATRPARRSDAFDPDQSPSAVGAPRPLGSAPLVAGSDLPPRRGITDPFDEEDEGRAPPRPLEQGAGPSPGTPPVSVAPAPRAAVPNLPAPGSVAGLNPSAPAARGPSVAATGSGDARGDYDLAYAALIQKQYDQAEMGFRRFLQSHPRDRLVPDATFWLGESYLQRNRPREAAEQFLKVTTEHARAGKAPDALLKLGVSLNAIGARDQACAAFAELERKYPSASASVKQGVDREQKRGALLGVSRRGPDAPLGEADFDLAFAPLAGEAAILAAVSGGPDSTCLMHALAAWAARAPGRPRILVASVDHGLRPAARQEAEEVGRAAAGLGLPHAVLAWSGRPPGRGASQAAARAARYRLLGEFARARGVAALVLAHTADDQAETVLLRLAAGSGPGGLAAMRPVAARGGLRLLRPLLHLPKARLVATCRANGWSFAEDLSNADPAYARARIRRLLPRLAAEGLDAGRLARLARRMARAEDALEAAADRAGRACGLARTPDGSSLDAAALLGWPAEIALRVLARAVAAGGGEAPRLERLEAALDAVLAAAGAGLGLRRSLAGRLLALDRAGRLAIRPEPPRRRGRTFTSIAAGPPHSLGIPPDHA